MPIRFKTETYCGIAPGESISTCSDVQVPIRDWNIEPSVVNLQYITGQNYPNNRLLTITYPEIWDLETYEDVSDFRFAIEVHYGNVEYFDLVTTTDADNITYDSNGKAYFQLQWKNLEQLPEAITSVEITHQAYGVRNGTEELLEQRSQMVNLQRIANNEDENDDEEPTSAPVFDKEMYVIVYNRDADTFIGDTMVNVENVSDPLQIILHTAGVAVGFHLDPEQTNSFCSIQRNDDIAEIYTDTGLYNYGLALQSPQGGYYDTAILRVIVTGLPANVVENLMGYQNFCKEDNYIQVSKSESEVDRLRMKLTMTFQLAESEAETIEETYEYLFIEEKLKLYPGEEIHDFFHRLSVDDLQESIALSSGLNVLTPQKVFKMASVNIVITEYDANWNAYNTYTLNDTLWIPGKKPKAFPYLTNGTLRSTYTQSVVCISALQQNFIDDDLHQIGFSLCDTTGIQENDWIVKAYFLRSSADQNYGALNIISHQGLSLEPTVNTQDVINCVFQNQNLCPDWFSFTDFYQRGTELEHVMTQNLSYGRRFKANVENDKKLYLNTGWIFYEELDLLEELISSTLCYVNTPNHGLIECIPVSKKPLKYDSREHRYQMIVEFEIIENER